MVLCAALGLCAGLIDSSASKVQKKPRPSNKKGSFSYVMSE